MVSQRMDSEDREPAEPAPIPYIALSQMTRSIRNQIVATTPFVHFWTDDWTTDFYRAQARLGFIAVATEGPGDIGNVLIPELQEAYAVLDWSDLHMDRSLRRIVNSGRLEHDDVRLVINPDPGPVLARLSQNWGARSWLVPEYVSLMRTLASPEEQARDTDFRILSTTLFDGPQPVAGELGYAIGRAYVSLSGFFRRDRREWDNFGKLQMVLLALHLRSAGFAFWNLGHPYMEYKTRLGARISPREEFLTRWDVAAGEDIPQTCGAGLESLPATGILSR